MPDRHLLKIIIARKLSGCHFARVRLRRGQGFSPPLLIHSSNLRRVRGHLRCVRAAWKALWAWREEPALASLSSIPVQRGEGASVLSEPSVWLPAPLAPPNILLRHSQCEDAWAYHFYQKCLLAFIFKDIFKQGVRDVPFVKEANILNILKFSNFCLDVACGLF